MRSTRRLVVAGRFNLHHVLQQRQHFRLVLLAEGEVGRDRLFGSFGGHSKVHDKRSL